MDPNLTHYWPISNGMMTDVVGTAHMTQGTTATTFVADRFGNPNSALNLNGGWTKVPAGFYFDTPEFSITAWVYPRSIDNWARIVDFGNAAESNNVFLTLSRFKSLLPAFWTYQPSVHTDSNVALKLEKWQFIVATYNSRERTIYIDGVKVATTTTSQGVPITSRLNCYIGKSNWGYDGYSMTILDDLRFYKKSLNQNEINTLMQAGL